VLETSPPDQGTAALASPDRSGSVRRRRALAVVVPVVLWVVIAAAGWLRLTPQVRNTVWAEDGKVFLEEQYDLGVLGALFHDYAGYLHVVPRLLVAVASHVASVDRFAVTVSILCVLVTAAVGAGVYVLTEGVLRSVVARVLLAFVPTLLPLGPMEIQANAANLHWFLMFLMPFMLLTPVRSWTKGIVLGVVALLCGLTEIQVVAFFPLFFLGIRNRHRWPVIAGAFIGGAAQVVTTLMHPRAPASVPHNSVPDMVLGYIVQPFGGTFTWSMPTIGRLIAEHGVVVVVLPFVVVLLLVAAGFWAGLGSQRWTLAAMIWGSAAVWFGAVLLNPNEMLAFAHFDDDQWRGIWTFRYSAAGSMYVLAGIVVVADVFLARRRLVLRVVGLVTVVVVVALFALNFSMDKANRQGGPFWEQQVESSQTDATCAAAPDGNATIEIAPGPQWAVTVPCALIDGGAAR
jgi:hypothetical protein